MNLHTAILLGITEIFISTCCGNASEGQCAELICTGVVAVFVEIYCPLGFYI